MPMSHCSISARLGAALEQNKENPVTKFRYLFASALLSLGLLTACETTVSATPTPGIKPSAVALPTAAPTLPPTPTSMPVRLVATPASPEVTAAQQITIEGTDRLTFVPDTITVTAGQPVKLTTVNSGKLDHTFTVPDLNIEVQMPAGQTSTFTFTAPQAGIYHFNSGVITEFDIMTGTLIVK